MNRLPYRFDVKISKEQEKNEELSLEEMKKSVLELKKYDRIEKK